MRKPAWTWLLVPLVAACAEQHPQSSSGSNWLRCDDVSDCTLATAVACEQGYCVDAEGQRIESTLDASMPADAANGPPAPSASVEAVLGSLLAAAAGPEPTTCDCYGRACDDPAEAQSAAVDCFVDAQAGCEPTTLEHREYTTEGGLVVTTYVLRALGEDCSVIVVDDASRDLFGNCRVSHHECAGVSRAQNGSAEVSEDDCSAPEPLLDGCDGRPPSAATSIWPPGDYHVACASTADGGSTCGPPYECAPPSPADASDGVCSVACTSALQCPLVWSVHCGDQTTCESGTCGFWPCQ